MIGAIGILRMVLSAQIQNKNWSHVIEKANWRIRIKEDFLTATGKIIAKQRQNLIMQFVSQLKKELKNTIK
jgi:HD superfamily phosphodiesterase